MLTARTLPKIWCQVYDCQSTCKWENVLRAGVHHTVAMCEVHGIVALQLNSVLLRPFSFALSKADKALRKKGRQPMADLPCVRCGSKRANRACKFWLCKLCCAELRMDCNVGEHVECGLARFPGIAPFAHDDLRISDAAVEEERRSVGRPSIPLADGRETIVHAICTHVWGPEHLTKRFEAYLSVPATAKVICLRDFTTATKKALGLEGLDLRRATTESATGPPAFDHNGNSHFTLSPLSLGVWSVYILRRPDERVESHGDPMRNVGDGKKRRLSDSAREGRGPKKPKHDN
ncbi:hypothetical protein EXIGLDRAFT_762155 [Exidia glandulosa HHB12029]|uniref:Uncharacterized protein n=1 Tax=Exidia glandulosa HHB12029 TaxID=1314781 RepID=A0A165N132_EXIGL|nr:hypothetical protein EXIGLDRAFT_762155 [Exidia glandulosa HHB12029]